MSALKIDDFKYETRLQVPEDLYEAALNNGPFLSEKVKWLYGRLFKECRRDLRLAAVLALVTYRMLHEYAKNEHQPAGTAAAEAQANAEAAKAEAAARERKRVNEQMAKDDALAAMTEQYGGERIETIAKQMYAICRGLPGHHDYPAYESVECTEVARGQYRWGAALALHAMAAKG